VVKRHLWHERGEGAQNGRDIPLQPGVIDAVRGENLVGSVGVSMGFDDVAEPFPQCFRLVRAGQETSAGVAIG